MPEGNAEEAGHVLTERKSNNPKKLILGEALPVEELYDSQGKAVSLEAYRGKYTVMTFWGSWCSHCREQLTHAQEFEKTLKAFPDTSYLLVNKLDGEKETRTSAEAYLEENFIPFDNLYDDGCRLYEAAGAGIVPTTLILDPDRKVVYCHAGAVTKAEEFRAALEYAHDGPAKAPKEFLLNSMLSGSGGLRTNLAEGDGNIPSGSDVLAESQGLLMLYAAESGERELFEETMDYCRENLQKDGLYLWVGTEKEDIASNALLDDLRILKAMYKADQRWGGLSEECHMLAESLYEKNWNGKEPVDFYDLALGEQAERFSLSYADLEAIGILEEELGEKGLRDKALEIVKGGYLGDAFPFYAAYYDYEKEEYDTGSLNMAEALYTLCHLAAEGEMPEASAAWIREKLSGEGIFARYTQSGEPEEGYLYESTGIYALTGLIGLEIGDANMVTQSVLRMEEQRIFDSTSLYNGAFGNADGTGIYSFDQCLALLLYARMSI